MPESDQKIGKTPSAMVGAEQWDELAVNLVRRGLCKVIPKSKVFHIGSYPLLNGLFSAGKDEVKDGVQVGRLTMNLKPWNSISRQWLVTSALCPSSPTWASCTFMRVKC